MSDPWAWTGTFGRTDRQDTAGETVRTCWCNQNPDLPVILRYQCDECRERVRAQVDAQIEKRTR